MKKLAKSRVSGTVLLSVLFFAAGCGSKEEDPLPNYVVNKVQTKNTAENTQANNRSSEVEEENALMGSSSIIQEDLAGETEKETEQAKDSQEEERKDLSKKEEDNKESDRDTKLKEMLGGLGKLSDAEDELYVTGTVDGIEEIYSNSVLQTVESAEEVYLLPAGTALDIRTLTAADQTADCFFYEEVPDTIFEKMKGNSYKEDCTVALSSLRYVRVLHYGFDGEVHIGELIVNQSIAQEIRDIFLELFDAKYPIEKMVLIDTYGGDDRASMEDNNTAAFNFRMVEGTKTLSKHALGLAVDINPLYNPYIPEREGVPEVLPENAAPYTDREAECEYYIRQGDLCYEAFVSRGFAWGGDWTQGKDYQHFSKTP